MSYREDDVGKVQTVWDYVLNDLWWDKVAYILRFTGPIYEMLRVADIDAPILHKVYEMWDSTPWIRSNFSISSIFSFIFFRHFQTNKLNSLAVFIYLLLTRYYTNQWIEEVRGCVASHKDAEIATERNKCLKMIFSNPDDRKNINMEFSWFLGIKVYDDDNMEDRWTYDPMLWWSTYRSSLSVLQTLTLKFLGQPCSSSCAERNWSTYSFIHCMRRNKITPKHAEDLVFVHSNLRFLSRKRPEYTTWESKKWDIGGDNWDKPFGGPELLEIAYLTLDEPKMETCIIENDDYVNDDDVIVLW